MSHWCSCPSLCDCVLLNFFLRSSKNPEKWWMFEEKSLKTTYSRLGKAASPKDNEYFCKVRFSSTRLYPPCDLFFAIKVDQLILHSAHLCRCVRKVNGQDVVKVGHRQVVNMIRQGGNSLMVKVVMVARNPELEDTARKRGTSQTFHAHRFQRMVTA